MFGFLGFGIVPFLDFLSFTLVFPICGNSSKIGFGKTAFVSVFTVFSRGVRVVRGVTIYIYTYICMYVFVLIDTSSCVSGRR